MYGLRIRTVSLSLGSFCDFFIPDEDMPAEVNTRGYEVFRDDLRAPNGNTFSYDKGRVKTWSLNFEAISTRTKDLVEHSDHGWLGKQQVSVIFFGTEVTGTTQSPGTYSASQVWGTGYVRLQKAPDEVMFDAWNLGITITQFGTNQSF